MTTQSRKSATASKSTTTARRRRTGRTGRALVTTTPPAVPAKPAIPAPAVTRDGADEDVRSSLDRLLTAYIARSTGGLSPASLMLAYADWMLHLMTSPTKNEQLLRKHQRKWTRFIGYLQEVCRGDNAVPPACIEPLPHDRRFSAPEWQQWPFNMIYQGFLLTQQWWHNATTGLPGMTKHHEEVVNFVTRQMLDVFSPSNSPFTNPEVIKVTAAEGGGNLVRGFENFCDDVRRQYLGDPPAGADAFQVGRDLAVTPGKVVYRNRLIELIQYAPQTEEVQAEPVLIVPAWIMKYYILDLSPENSLIRWLVGKGHTVFVVSWKNPGADDRDLGMEDYRTLGLMAAVDAVSKIVPKQKIHAAGYCLGGTLLSLGAAAMSRDGDDRLATVTLFAAQTDFADAGELQLFIDDSEVSFLDDLMWEQGYLDPKRMTSAFQLLRSRDLIWSKMVADYLKGERRPMNDLMAWNADGTRLPYRMHAEYLRSLFLNNDFSNGRYRAGDRAVAVTDIRPPVFVVSTETDHVAPWRSVHKIHLLADTEITFVLTSGGHNAGIVSEPGHPHRSFRIKTKREEDAYLDPDAWLIEARQQDGSWWPAWHAWLSEHSTGTTPPPAMGASGAGLPPLADAPGTYVFER